MLLSLLIGLGIQASATITLCDEEIKLDALLNHIALSKGLDFNRSGIPDLWMNVRVESISVGRLCGAIEAATGGRITTDERQLRFKHNPQPEPHELARRELNDALAASRRVLGFGFKYLKGRIEELEERFRDRPARLYDTDPIWLADSKELSQLRRFDKPASYAFARTQEKVGNERIKFIPCREALKFYDEARGGVSDTKVDPIFVFIYDGAPKVFLWTGSGALVGYETMGDYQDVGRMPMTPLKVPPQQVPAFRIKRWDKLLTNAQYWQMASIGTGLPLVGISSRQYQPSPPVGRVSAFVRDGIIVESRLSSQQREFPPELTIQEGEFPPIMKHARLIASAKLDSTYGLAHAFPFFEIGRGWSTPRALAILGSLTDSEQNAVMAGQTLKVSNLRSTTRQAIHYGLLLESNFAVDGLIGRHGASNLMTLKDFEMKLTQGKQREVTLAGTGRKAIETEFELTVALPGSAWPKWAFSWMSSAD